MFLFPFFSGLQRVGKAVDRPREFDNIAVRGGYKGAKIFARSLFQRRFQPRMGGRKGPLRGVAAEIMV